MKISILIVVAFMAFFFWAGGRALDHGIAQVDERMSQIQQAEETP